MALYVCVFLLGGKDFFSWGSKQEKRVGLGRME